jgi:hypothetical protein
MQYCWRLAYLTMLGLAIGCSSRPATVALHGEVTFEGRSIEKGKIDLLPIDNTPGASVVATIKDGKYDIPAKWGPLPNGSYLVQIVGFRKSNMVEPNRMPPGGPSMPIEENYIPAAYNRDSTLKVKIADLSDKTKADFRIGAGAR